MKIPGIGMALLVLAWQAQGQAYVPATDSSKLNDAVALIHNGNPQKAVELLATINAADPEYSPAQYYNALALYEGKDVLHFMQAMAALPTNDVPVTAELREDLCFKQIDALFQYHKFDTLI